MLKFTDLHIKGCKKTLQQIVAIEEKVNTAQ